MLTLGFVLPHRPLCGPLLDSMEKLTAQMNRTNVSGPPPNAYGAPPGMGARFPPNQGYPPGGMPGYPPQNYQRYPPQHYLPQGYPPQGYPGGMPGYPPQGYPPQGYPGGMPGYPLQQRGPQPGQRPPGMHMPPQQQMPQQAQQLQPTPQAATEENEADSTEAPVEAEQRPEETGKEAEMAEEGGGDWKETLNLPDKDERIKTEVRPRLSNSSDPGSDQARTHPSPQPLTPLFFTPRRSRFPRT